MTARGSWKRSEREVAKRLGGRRVPVSGRGRGDVPDIDHELFSVEVKHWSAFPVKLLKAMEQAVAAKKGDRVPLVVLHKADTHHDLDLCIMFLKDFGEMVDNYLTMGVCLSDYVNEDIQRQKDGQ